MPTRDEGGEDYHYERGGVVEGLEGEDLREDSERR